MKIIEAYPIGTEVWFFDPVLDGEMPIKKSVVLGSFVHKTEGELFYFLLGKQIEGFAVYDNEADAMQMRDVFYLYRDKLLEANKENKIRFDKVREGCIFDEYKVDNLPTEESLNEQSIPD